MVKKTISFFLITILILVFSLGFPDNLMSQISDSRKAKIDSFEILITEANEIDKIDLMESLFGLVYPGDMKRCREIADETMRLALKHDLKDKQVLAFSEKAAMLQFLAKFDSTQIIAAEGLQVAEQINAKKEIYRLNNLLGIVQERTGSLDSAIYFYEKAMEVDLENKLSIYNNLGKVYRRKGEFLKSIKYLELAMLQARKFGVVNSQGIIAQNIGRAFAEIPNEAKAREYFLLSFELKKEVGDHNGTMEALFYLTSHLSSVDERKKYFNQGKLLAEKVQDTSFFMSFINIEADILREEGKYEEGIALLLANEEKAKQVFPYHDLADFYIVLSKLFTHTRNFAKSEEFGKKAMSFAKKADRLDRIQNAREVLLMSYSAQKDHKSYFEIANQFYELKDSLESQKKLDQFAMFDAQLDEEQKQKVELLNKSVAQKEKSRLRLGIIGLLSVLLLLTILYFRNQRIKNQKKIIEKEKETANKLEELDRIKTDLYTNITHEFRTPLTVISGIASQLTGNEKEKKLIGQNSDQLLDLVNQMLDLSKLESESMPLVLKQADIIKYISYLIESFDSYSSTINVQVHLISEEEKLMMDFDQEKITRVVSNLLSNALKFTTSGGNVYIHLRKQDTPADSKINSAHCLSLIVRDTGQGIPPNELAYIFDRFYQVDNSSTRKGEGTGIGLTLVKELIKTMKGEIAVASNVGEGTSFTILLPITNNASIDGGLKVETKIFIPEKNVSLEYPALVDKVDSDEMAANGKPTVLIVEDNAHVVHYLVNCLQQGYNIDIAMDGQEGIEKAISNIPDIVVSDIMMPLKDGFEVCQTLKTDERTSHIPIVMLTAKADIESRLTGLQRGADAYLSKPFNQDELLINLQNLLALRKKLQAKYTQLTIGQEEVDRAHNDEAHSSDATAIEHIFLKKIRTLVEEDLGNADFGSHQLCRGLNMSRSQIYKKVKALTGGSPSKYIRSIRLYHAREMLKAEDLNISEVAYAVGFTSPTYFSTKFVEEFGIRPNESRA